MEKNQIPASHLDLVNRSKKTFAYLATVMPDGSPQNTPVWFEYRDGDILINSARGRTKDRNIRQHPQVSVLIPDPSNPYRYVQLRGRVAEITEEGAADHINELSRYYKDTDFPLNKRQQRVIYRIVVERVDAHG